MRSALAAVLAGDRERARTLCQWAHETFQSVSDEVQYWMSGGPDDDRTAGEVLMWDALAQLLLGADPASLLPQFRQAQDIQEPWLQRLKLSSFVYSLWPRRSPPPAPGWLPAPFRHSPTNKRERLHGYFYGMALEAAFPDLTGGQDPLTIKRT